MKVRVRYCTNNFRFNLTIAHDVSKEIHLCMLLSQLESLVNTVTDDKELDGGGEVSKLDEEPRHHFGPLSAAGLLHNSNRVLRVVEFIQEEPHRRVAVPGRLVGHNCLLVLPVSLGRDELVLYDLSILNFLEKLSSFISSPLFYFRLLTTVRLLLNVYEINN